jgi:hypothetical protein
MTKFRVSAHNLNIERGCYIGLKVEERLCKLCYTDIEDEEHFLINCPTLHNTRKHYFYLIKRNCHNFVSLNNKQKLSWLMITEDLKFKFTCFKIAILIELKKRCTKD